MSWFTKGNYKLVRFVVTGFAAAVMAGCGVLGTGSAFADAPHAASGASAPVAALAPQHSSLQEGLNVLQHVRAR